jgi:hypothetical protein
MFWERTCHLLSLPRTFHRSRVRQITILEREPHQEKALLKLILE